jgi:FkbM family methyltransferase
MRALSDLAKYFASHPLTRDAQFAAWSRFVAWQVRSRLQDEVIFSWIEGQKLAVRRGMWGATGNIYLGLHEFADMMLPLHVLRDGDLFLDIGANVGTYTVLAAGVRGASVWAFEPDPDTARALKRNIDLNRLGDRVVVHELVLGDADGEVAFTRGLDTVNRVATAEDVSVRKVPMRRLDSVIGAAQPLMIKMDVEGHEEHVIRGARGLLAGDSLKVVEIETSTPETEAILLRHGFERAYYDPFRRSLTTTLDTDLGASNAVFVRDWDNVAARLAGAPTVQVLGRSI